MLKFTEQHEWVRVEGDTATLVRKRQTLDDLIAGEL